MVDLSVIVTTIGRPEDVARLAASLANAAGGIDLEFIVIDQSPDQCCIRALAAEQLPFPYRSTTSDRGASLGRNTGARLAAGEFLTFPDDGCTYPPDSLRKAIDKLAGRPDLAGFSGIQRTPNGAPSMLRWPAQGCLITKRNHYRTAIESTVFIRRTAFETLGGFDVELGTGSQGPYQSGEISDLLLHGLEAGMSFDYDPSVVVFQPDSRDEATDAFVGKMRGYGRGFGRVFGQHAVGVDLFASLLARKLAGSLWRSVRGQRVLARSDRAFVSGAVQGYRSWPR